MCDEDTDVITWPEVIVPYFGQQRRVQCDTCDGTGNHHCRICNSIGACHDCCMENVEVQRVGFKRADQKRHQWIADYLRAHDWFGEEAEAAP